VITQKTQSNIRWGLGLLALLAAAGCAQPGAQTRTAAAAAGDPVARGLYIVNAGGCHDCHTPWKMGAQGPEPDMSRALSGHPETESLSVTPNLGQGPWISAASATNTAFAGPWGISFAANLTPDTNTGLGIWTEDMFIKAIRTGRHMGTSRPINPPMPWPAFRNFSDEDLHAIWSYLRSLKPMTNHVPDYLPPPTTTASAEGAAKDVRQ
jgi:mono/diheme cytochrome c family protein